MSEVVVRMEMPKSCDLCPCLDDNGDYPRCRITNEQRGYTFNNREKRMPGCPIVCALPENHGRLVDADEVLKRAIGTKCFRGDYSLMLEELVGESTTIVQAERRANDGADRKTSCD